MNIYVSMDITGTNADFPRAAAIAKRVNSAEDDRLAIVPFLLFREVLFKSGKLRAASVSFCIKMMEKCDEVWVFDDPKTCLTCENDITFAHGMGKPVVEMFKKNFLEDIAMAEIMTHYQECLGGFPPRMSFEEIGFYLDKGIEADVIKEAISIGVRNQKPWGYINGILKRLLAEGIFTIDAWKEANRKRKGGASYGCNEPNKKYDNIL